jgi:hypothetical protein
MTKEELLADLKAFEAAWKRENKISIRRVFERIAALGTSKPMPSFYRMKLPPLPESRRTQRSETSISRMATAENIAWETQQVDASLE